MKRFELFILVLLHFQIVNAQSVEDSLLSVYQSTSIDSTRIKILHQLFDINNDHSPERAEKYILEAIEISKVQNFKRYEASGLNRYAHYLRSQSKDDSAIIVNTRSLDLSRKIDYLKGQSDALLGLGSSYARVGSFDDAKKYLNRNLKIAIQGNDSLAIAKSYNVLAAINTQQIEYTEAMDLYTKASKIFQNLGANRNHSRALGNIGFIHRNLGNYGKAESYFRESDDIARKENFTAQLAFNAYNLSIVYRELGQLDRAVESNQKAIEIYSKLGDAKRVSFGYFTMGKINLKKEDYETALINFKESLKISKKVRDSVNIGHSFEHIAKCLHKLNRNQEAKENLNKALEIAVEIDLEILRMKVYEILADVHTSESEYEEALLNYKQFTDIQNRIYTREKVDLANDIEAKYQNEQKEQEIALLQSEKQLQTLQLNKRLNERNAIIVFTLVILLLAGLSYNQYRIKRKANEQLRELDRLKSNFFANISHEFRTPLTLIKGPIEQLEQNPDDKLSLENIKMIRRNATRVLKLVNQLLDLSKIDQGNLKLNPTEGDVYKCLRASTSSFNSHAAQRNIDYHIMIPKGVVWASFDRDKLDKIVYNLLSNAFKFSPDNSLISFKSDFDTSGLFIQVKDTGKGIPEDKLPFIFDRFYQVDGGVSSEQEGTGIGLSLSKDLVDLMDGTLTVRSELDKGTCFTIQLPIREIKTGEEKGVSSSEPKYGVNEDLEKIKLEPKDLRDVPSILMVEDNADMRHFIREQIIHSYKVFEATDGQMGYKKSISLQPDLIITDLMMPKMDGIELCKKLKTNVDTSHIPVIMLTAKAGIENRIEGLETGADDYLTKPFDAKELLVRSQNLIEQRKKLRELFAKSEVNIDPKKVTVNSIDQRFLESLINLLELNYADSEFGVPQIQHSLAMSKTQLHRKVKALTNEAPGELLRNFRLKRAAQLLSQKADTVTQIAYMVGFNNLSYFAKCFKQRYGIPPSSYS